ncbi:MAG: ribonuclease HI [Bacteroidetes bacterium]|nr:ribonuclease HI [Bacteroidota bacterium]
MTLRETKMKYYKLNMEITDEDAGNYSILISDGNSKCIIRFSPEKKDLMYFENNDLTQFIKLREFQLRKLLHNKRPETFYKGFKLNFVLHDGLPDTNFYDLSKITVVDNRTDEFLVKKTDSKTDNIPELFTDGSFNNENKQGGFAILIKTVQNEYYIHQLKTEKKDNNLLELTAVIEGIKYLKKEPKIRIVTDSQYVIKGISEWLPLWKLNDFYTANGTKAKNIKAWKTVDQLIQGKYLEFEWIKAHADHFENTLCDLKAKSIYKNK